MVIEFISAQRTSPSSLHLLTPIPSSLPHANSTLTTTLTTSLLHLRAVYVNSFFAMLNSRNRLRHIGAQDSSFSPSQAQAQSQSQSQSQPFAGAGAGAVSAPRFRRASWVETQRGEDAKFFAEDGYGGAGIRVRTETFALSDLGSSVDQKTAVSHEDGHAS